MVTGGALADNGSWATWTTGAPGVLFGDSTGTRRVCSDATPVAAAFVDRGTGLEVVDASKRAIWALEDSGQCRIVRALPGNEEIVSGAHLDGYWLLGIVDAHGQSRLRRLDPGKNAGTDIPVPSAARRQMSLRYASLAGSMDGIIVAPMRWPFRWHVLGPDGAVRRTGQPFIADTIIRTQADSVRASVMMSLAVVDLGKGYLQIVADARSDIRALVLYDASGNRLRIMPLQVPLGLLASMQGSNRLLMLRRSDIVEVVTYGWRWSP